MDDAVDRSFGIRYENGHFMMDDIILKIYNIVLDDEVYVGTSGLWTLITDKRPKTYTKVDYERYKELLHETNVMYRDYDPKSSYPRPNRTTKWNEVLLPIREEFMQKGIVHSDDDEYISVVMDCIYRKMDATSIFEELILGYISDHVLC